MFHVEFLCHDKHLPAVLRLLQGRVYKLSSRPLADEPGIPKQKRKPNRKGTKIEKAARVMKKKGSFRRGEIAAKGFAPATVQEALAAVGAVKQADGSYSVRRAA